MSTQILPAAFIGHGSPMNALETNQYTKAWQAFGASISKIAKPRAILVISAHWYGNFSSVTAMENPKTIHDFYGFPQELFNVQYNAPGSPELAQEIVDIINPTHIDLDTQTWGIDHGTWSVLIHAFPNANIPVIQLSIDARQPFEYHLDLGERLAPLRNQGVVIIGSGNIVHNLGTTDWTNIEGGFDWAKRFNDETRNIMTSCPQDILNIKTHQDFMLAVPTPEHFIPLLYIAGLAKAANTNSQTLIDGLTYGSISMTSYGVYQLA